MNYEQAIKYFEKKLDGGILPGAREVYKFTLQVLREAKPENPQPLTVEELKRRKGKPVWIVWSDGRIQSKWWIVGSNDWNMMEFFSDYIPSDYGKTWLAYDYPPQEAQL